VSPYPTSLHASRPTIDDTTATVPAAFTYLKRTHVTFPQSGPNSQQLTAAHAWRPADSWVNTIGYLRVSASMARSHSFHGTRVSPCSSESAGRALQPAAIPVELHRMAYHPLPHPTWTRICIPWTLPSRWANGLRVISDTARIIPTNLTAQMIFGGSQSSPSHDIPT
jgi:hypothetical protein